MSAWRIGFGVVMLAACGSAPSPAEAAPLAISCKGEAIRDFKSFNLPAKTVQETRIYVIDEAEKSIAMVADGELVPLCDKTKPACHADFLPAGIKVDYQNGEESLKLIFNRGANTIGDQSENATLMTTFEGHCQPAELPAIAPAK